jgi:hypothetical protein
MPSQIPVVEPIDPNVDQSAQTPPPEAPQASPEAAAPAPLPPSLLKVPAFQALVAGSPAAVSMKVKGSEDRDEVKMVQKNAEALQEAGMGFYLSLNKQIGVMFNQLRIHPQDLVAADKAGKLLMVAPDFDAVNHEVSKAGRDHPALHAAPPVAAMPAPVSAQSAPQMASGKFSPPLPASAARKILQQRIANMQPSAPTGGPMPGAGILANQIARPVI